MNRTAPKIRGKGNDAVWEDKLLKQGKPVLKRLAKHSPTDIRKGLLQDIVNFSIYELLLSARNESGLHTSEILLGPKKALEFTLQLSAGDRGYTVVFKAIAFGRYMQEQTGMSIERFVRVRAPVRRPHNHLR